MKNNDDTFQDGASPRSARKILEEIEKAKDAFRPWQNTCMKIDRIYSQRNNTSSLLIADVQDNVMDVFWASFEVIKEAVYARPPQPVVVPLFKDNKLLNNKTAEILERCTISTFKDTHIHDVMTLLRDDLIFDGRASPWVRHEIENGKHRICIEHLDRCDFIYEPARYWSQVGWGAGGFWLSKDEMRKRFKRTSGDAYQEATYDGGRNERDGSGRSELENRATTDKCKVWEVWHKADNKVYFVTEGCDAMLDEIDPPFDVEGFFPFPRPAFGTLQRRSLIPVPDYQRYEPQFMEINKATARIMALMNSVRMKGIVFGGSNIGDAVMQLMDDDNNASMLVNVEGLGLTQGGDVVTWLPLAELATTIQGLFEARGQLINDYYELSGISDIMRGATDASETLGAQQLKSQYGSIRVRAKSTELQRVAADCVRLAAEIIAEKFPQKQILEMAQMEIPTRKEIDKRIKDVETSAENELTALAQQAQQVEMQAQQSGEQVDPEQIQQMFSEQQQQIMAKYGKMLAEIDQIVPIEEVMALLRDDRTRCFTFEIESSSTILTDEMGEKESRNEFLQQFASVSQSLMSLAAMGETGARMAGAMLKFALAPYRAGRELDGIIDEFIDQAPQMAEQMSQQEGEGKELAAAQKALADAEMEKARAAMMKVEVDAKNKQMEMQGRLQQLELEAADKGAKFQLENGKLQLQLQKQEQEFAAKMAEVDAKIDLMRAQTAKLLSDIGLDVQRQNLEEYRVAEQSQQRQIDNERAMMGEQQAMNQNQGPEQ